ncbi:dipeptide/oligopeptide/nickel ABC transporter ATP-binding protein [Solirubrobacter ginsenosidimutans]|uniref:Dipeptide/oligopeptide/nickel ABC transporter ATP-binding protein n=1 Tax=Solirubrobacter ginsenosidimutans TaxID=490573 RepID=A0A9X3MPF6_9ACTN|nr:dipeptide/oligopeptide/nickel ABC transporter ATP-binding protein [Solirubrobacter ginsenosidimutans]MDA0159412.1 dipeptide/oligopeptide/nickel ABC transporter ATP-binding protein [Solirubrobacter ginsenosidimutans]
MPSPSSALLEIRGLRVRFGAQDVLRGVDLDVAPGEIVGVIGETGSGKTTLARSVVGLVKPSAGAIRYEATDLVALGDGRRRRAFRRSGAIQLVFQDPLRSLDPGVRISQTVTEGLAVRGRLSARERRMEAERALALVGLGPELLERIPGDISGGQRQRVAVARALVTRPRLILLDEPVSALDASNRGALLRTLGELRDELGAALVIISHDLASMAGVVDRVVVLYEGAVVEHGPIERVFAAPEHEYTRLLLAAAPAAALAAVA